MPDEAAGPVEAIRRFAEPDIALDTRLKLCWSTCVGRPIDAHSVETSGIRKIEVYVRCPSSAKVGTVLEDAS